jgi:hypothetical protein
MPGQTRPRPSRGPAPNAPDSPAALGISPAPRGDTPARVSDAAYEELRARIVDLTLPLRLSRGLGIRGVVHSG